MQPFTIFAEGKSDTKFIADYLKTIFGLDPGNVAFVPLGSWSGYKTEGKPTAAIRQAHDSGKRIILIADADNNFEDRQKEVLSDFDRFKIPVALFLFPNHQQPGNLEDLLTDIAVRRDLMACFFEYEKCVAQYRKKLGHARIYAYLDMLLSDRPKQEREKLLKAEHRDYTIEQHWNLHHHALQSFKTFLSSLLSLPSAGE